MMMETAKINLRFGVISIMILLATLSRLIPHPANFAPVGGIALFGAAYYSRHYLAFAVPVVSMWISNLVLNNVVYSQYFDGFVWFYAGSLYTYGAFALIVLTGFFVLRQIRVVNLVIATVGASVIFFVVSNFCVWLSSGMYPQTFDGLVSCYIAGIPFFKNTVAGDFLYTAILFGAFEYSVKRFPKLQEIAA
jgi:hypothetical protein